MTVIRILVLLSVALACVDGEASTPRASCPCTASLDQGGSSDKVVTTPALPSVPWILPVEPPPLPPLSPPALAAAIGARIVKAPRGAHYTSSSGTSPPVALNS